tara:strand:+ start:198 stop:1136 length:939 start_codon:yes stop_codon:yes gene_type:complete
MNQIKTQKLSVKKIAEMCRSGQWTNTKTIDVVDFFIHLGNGEYKIDADTRFQVRGTDVDRERIKRAVNKIKASGDLSGLRKITLVWFEKLQILKIINGNHTIEIMLDCKILTTDANVVSFEKDLGGKLSKVRRLGNLLNEETVETVATSTEDVRNELWVIMDENKEEGRELEPTSEQKQDFLNAYPFIDEYQFAQFVNRHPDTKAYTKCDKTYKTAELKSIRESYRSQLKYKDYAVLYPHVIDTFRQVPISEAFKQMRDEGKKKCLIPFYCNTIVQRDSLIQGDIVKKMKTEYTTLASYWGATIEFDFLAYN